MIWVDRKLEHKFNLSVCFVLEIQENFRVLFLTEFYQNFWRIVMQSTKSEQ